MPHFKFFVFRNQWWLLIVAVIGAGSALATWKQPLSIYLTVFAVIGSIFYFLQRQNLDEMILFRELFKEFNARYDAMNGYLADVLATGSKPLSSDEQKWLVDYFNLCGEEYFYFSRGFVDPRVWNAWRNGMLQYLKDPRIHELWKMESKSDSYYGLDVGLREPVN